MVRVTESKIILIKRKTRLDELIHRFNTLGQAKFYIEHLGADFDDYLEEDRVYKEAVTNSSMSLSTVGRVQVIDREFVSNFIFGKDDLVVVVGQDGLVVNVLKYLNGQNLIAVNPDPKRWDGVLLPFYVDDIIKIVTDTFNNIRKTKSVTIAEAILNDGQSLLAVNDFFIGQKTHTSARYEIEYKKFQENQSSSGVIVSTGLGSTGWLKSVLKGAESIVNSCLNKHLEISLKKKLQWDSNFLYFSVREPYKSKSTGAEFVFGEITKNQPFKIISKMGENGVIFSDGIESDFLSFNSGVEAEIKVSDRKGRIVV